jgi:hypothetical protein
VVTSYSVNRMNRHGIRSGNFGVVTAAAIASLLSPAFGSAATVPLRNGSFEAPALPGEGKQSTNSAEGWKLTGGAGVFVNNGAFGAKIAGADGAQLAYLNGTKEGGFQQDTAGHIKPMTIYTLTAGVGLRQDSPLKKGASLLLKLQSFDTNNGALLRTLAVKEITVGREALSAERLTDFTATLTTGPAPPRGGLRVALTVGDRGDGDKGDWSLDQVRLETRPATPEGVAGAASAAPLKKTAATGGIRYNRDIRPILSENCFACHGPDSASRKAGLRLDRFEDATAPRKGARAVVPGKPDQSDAIARIFTTDEDDLMPPPKSHKVLTPAQKELLRRWVAEGARYELHWAYIAPERPALPTVKNTKWAHHPIDRFVLARLEKEGLRPAPEADRRTLARRLSLDLTGLPPSPEDVEAFLKDTAPDAVERLADKFMASPHWGEHRARYWLDAARYADTHGIHFDNFREMWTYRDWVIHAFNANLPFDRFTIEQLAGDLLPGKTMEQEIATGFNRCNMTSNEGGLIDEEYLVLYTRDRTETTSTVWMGMTAQCATCHDHKFDPITTREFYEMAAFFNNSTVPSRDGNRRDAPPTRVVPASEDRARWDALPPLLDEAKQKAEARRKDGRKDYDTWAKTASAEPFTRQVPADRLALHAALTEGEGTNAAFTVGAEQRTLSLGTNVIWGSGHIGARAFKTLGGATARIEDAGDFDTTNAFAYGAWVKMAEKDLTGAAFGRMDEQKNGYRGWDFYFDKGRPATHIVHQWPDQALKVVAKDKLKAGEWAHVFITYDGSAKPEGVKIFVNGRPVDADTTNKKLASTNSIRAPVPFTLGQRHVGDRLDKTSLQDARVYARTLDASDVEAIYRGTRGAWLARKPAEDRTKEEGNEMFDHWLGVVDEPFRAATKHQASLEREEAGIKKRGSIAYVMNERGDEAMAHILYRGEYDKRRDRVLADTPDVLPPLPEALPRNRLGLARWLLRPEHPLTARVTVTRFWQEVFGAGLVKSSSDFGVTGDQPTHPELLDWLAVEFRESGWDVKKFFKLLVTSAAYRQAATVTPEKLQKDPQNRLLSRGPRFRMDAEMVRDCALAASGLLAPKVGGPSVKPYQPDGVWEAVAMPESNTKKYERDTGEKLYRRSVYTFWKRAAPPASMEIFNAPNRETCSVRRERTNTPLQALATLNDPQFVEAARHLAQRALLAATTEDRRLDYIARRLLGRSFRPEEEKIARNVLKDLLAYYLAETKDAEALIGFGESKADPSLSRPELAAYTMAVNQFMNLDEVLNK